MTEPSIAKDESSVKPTPKLVKDAEPEDNNYLNVNLSKKTEDASLTSPSVKETPNTYTDNENHITQKELSTSSTARPKEKEPKSLKQPSLTRQSSSILQNSAANTVSNCVA